MYSLKTLLLLFGAFYGIVSLIVLDHFFISPSRSSSANPTSSKAKTLMRHEKLLINYQKPKRVYKFNPFEVFGAYPDPKNYSGKANFNVTWYGLEKDDNYCKKVDLMRLTDPEIMFNNEGIFFSDFLQGSALFPQIKKYGKSPWNNAILLKNQTIFKKTNVTTPFNQDIIGYHVTKSVFHHQYKIGSHFLCATQTFNHIPNHTALVSKGLLLDMIQLYDKRHVSNPACFDSKSLFLSTYRLDHQDECKQFFGIINSKEYNKTAQTVPVQYLIKSGKNSHKDEGSSLFDEEKRTEIVSQFQNGELCGNYNTSIIAQKYIANPLLLDRKNKFDIRVFLLVASTNPIIAFYHDGYLRVSVNPFDQTSKDSATHLTNTAVADSKDENKNTEERKDEHLWTFKELEKYLLENNITTHENWLKEELRPSIQKAFIHLIRMTKRYFWKQSNVYELFGLDFMLDDKLQLWYIECNPHPLITGVMPKIINRMLSDMFEIQLALYRSRMQRVLKVIEDMMVLHDTYGDVDFDFWIDGYKDAVRNRIDPEYQISKNNTWIPIINENLKGSRKYFGLLRNYCIDL